MNVRRGDMAIIIKVCNEHADCLGRIVTVCEWDLPECAWQIEFAGTIPPSMSDADIFVSPDHTLRPVSGLSDTGHQQIDIIEACSGSMPWP